MTWDARLVALTFLLRPLLFLADVIGWTGMAAVRGWGWGVVAAACAPMIGALLLRRHPRARFAAYVFLTVDVIRWARLSWPRLALSAAVLLWLQTPRMRRVWPTIDPKRVWARYSR